MTTYQAYTNNTKTGERTLCEHDHTSPQGAERCVRDIYMGHMKCGADKGVQYGIAQERVLDTAEVLF